MLAANAPHTFDRAKETKQVHPAQDQTRKAPLARLTLQGDRSVVQAAIAGQLKERGAGHLTCRPPTIRRTVKPGYPATGTVTKIPRQPTGKDSSGSSFRDRAATWGQKSSSAR